MHYAWLKMSLCCVVVGFFLFVGWLVGWLVGLVLVFSYICLFAFSAEGGTQDLAHMRQVLCF
jgi:hypothetical protein